MLEEILRSQFATEDSLRLALLFCAESTTLLNVIDEYFSVNTLFALVLFKSGVSAVKTGLHLTLNE